MEQKQQAKQQQHQHQQQDKQRQKYRVLAGSHSEESIKDEELRTLDMGQLRKKAEGLGMVVPPEATDAEMVRSSIKASSLRTYRRGDIVETTTDLLKLNSPGSQKFEKIDDSKPQADRTYTAAELQAMANAARAREELETEAAQRTPQTAGPHHQTTHAQAQQAAAQAAQQAAAQQHPNQPHQQPKSQNPNAPQTPQDRQQAEKRIDSMSLKELQSLAAEEEIDLKGATKHEDVKRTVKAALLS